VDKLLLKMPTRHCCGIFWRGMAILWVGQNKTFYKEFFPSN